MKKTLTYILFLAITVIFYYKSYFSFFEGDEWFYFSEYFPLLTNPLNGLLESVIKGVTDSYWMSGGGHVTPLQSLLWFVFILLFKLKFGFYIAVAFLIHSLNAFLLFYLSKRLFKNSVLACFVSIYFLTNASHFQAVSWAMVIINDLLLTTFILLSLLLQTKGLFIKKKIVVISALCFMSALLIKETAAILFFIYPLFSFLFNRKLFKKSLLVVVIIAFLYLPFRFVLPAIFSEGKLFQNNLSVSTETFWNYILTTSGMIVQNITSISLNNPRLSICVFVLTVILLGYAFLTRKQETSRIIIFGVVIILSNALLILPTSLFSTRNLEFNVVDSRYLYLVSIGIPLIAVGVFDELRRKIVKEYIVGFQFVIISLFILLMLRNYYVLQYTLSFYEQTGIVRRDFLTSLQNQVGELKRNPVFLVESNEGYYGFSEIPPFQTNLGQIIAVIYFNKGYIAPEILNDRSIQKLLLTKSWYLNKADNSFGYYLNREDLFDDGMKYSINPESIYAFKWDGEKNILTNNFDEFRKEYEEEIIQRKTLHEWKRINFLDFSVLIDPSYLSFITIEKVLKDKSVFFHDYVLGLENSDGEKINASWKTQNISNLKHGVITVVYVLSGSYPIYLVPSHNGESYISVRAVGEHFLRDTQETVGDRRAMMLENIIKSLEYNNKQ